MARHSLSRSERDRARHRRDPRVQMLSAARRRAKKAGIPFDLTKDDVVVPKVCPVLGFRLVVANGRCAPRFASPSLDRIINELGYVKGNVIVVSLAANQAKSNLTVGQLEQVVKFYRRLTSSLSLGRATISKRKRA